MRHGWTIAFVMLALLVGGIITQLPLAAADDSSNPFGPLWDAIFDLQSRDEQLQAQIDELRAERETLLAQSSGGEPAVLVSDLYATIKVEALEQDRALVYITVGNNGPDRAAGVKLTTFYLMPLFEINSIDGDLCMDKSRGIIECIIGTLEQDQKVVITVDATARESGKTNTWTVDVSTTTDDADYSNNHVTYDFETGSDKPVEEIPEIQQPEEPEEVEGESETSTEPEQDDDISGVVPINSTKVEEQKNIGNHTSTESGETPSENQTSTETQDSGSNNNNNNATNTDIEEPENSESEEVDDDSGWNSTNTTKDEPEQLDEDANTKNEETQEEQPGESESSQPTTEEQQTQDEQSEESGSEPAVDEPSEESPVKESSDSSQESSESNESREGGSSGGESSDSG